MAPKISETTLPDGMPVFYLRKQDLKFMYDEMPAYFEQGIEVRKGDTVFDIGANIGLFALNVHQRCEGEGAVYAFEPIPAIYEALARNVARSASGMVRALPYGISREAKQLSFTYYPNAPIGSTAYHEDAMQGVRKCKEAVLKNVKELPETRAKTWWIPRFILSRLMDMGIRRGFQPQEVVCEVRTVSDVIREYSIERIHLLKVDAEYAEMDVLMGISAEDWPKIGQVLVEVHDGRVDEISAVLKDHGFARLAVDQLPLLKGSDQYLVYAMR